MIFNTWTFAVFGLSVLVVYWSVVPLRWKAQFLVLAGTIFYAYSVPAYLLLLVALAGTTFFIGHAMLRAAASPRARKAWLALGVVLITAVLAYFKYSKFFALTIDQVTNLHLIPIPNIIVPLAISFFTFEFVHVLVDIYLKKITRLNALEFVVFTMFFPTLVAGPIKRYQTFAPQVRNLVTPDSQTFMLNFYRVTLGLAKKMIVADSMQPFIAPLLIPGAPYGQLDYIVAALAYSVKIYFDFSGYSDIAIGVAGLLGFAIPENFDMPYRRANISLFWRHWHISLSSWVRDYVFIPLGGSRRSAILTGFNLFVAMGLAGLWHGANWTFVIWGLWHGLGLASHRVWSQTVVPRVALLSRPSAAIAWLSTAATFAFVLAGWVLFAAPSLRSAAVAFAGFFVRV
jgi:alginate O-acetyltransferase complex protein AlgI